MKTLLTRIIRRIAKREVAAERDFLMARHATELARFWDTLHRVYEARVSYTPRPPIEPCKVTVKIDWNFVRSARNGHIPRELMREFIEILAVRSVRAAIMGCTEVDLQNLKPPSGTCRCPGCDV